VTFLARVMRQEGGRARASHASPSAMSAGCAGQKASLIDANIR